MVMNAQELNQSALGCQLRLWYCFCLSHGGL